MPRDTLTANELSDANIKIYPTTNVQLYLRRSALDIPLFRDAQAGVFNGVSIVLVDSERLYPEDVFNSVSPDALGLYRVYRKIFDEDIEPYYTERIESLEKWIQENERKWETGEIEEDKYKLVGQYYKNELDLGRKKLTGFNAPRGIFMDGRTYKEESPQFLEGESEDLVNSITIYMAVGGKTKPNPKQSTPSREHFPDRDDEDRFILMLLGDYRVKSESVTAGFILHHEVSHYETRSLLIGSSEYQTDTNALERIERAHQDLENIKRRRKIFTASQIEVSSTSYPFIFVTNEGITITKNMEYKNIPNEIVAL